MRSAVKSSHKMHNEDDAAARSGSGRESEGDSNVATRAAAKMYSSNFHYS